ncbi:hypothetical protein PMIN06_000626 [Paraphaeosphaeria minitans]|uniref:RNA-dependent RNA polymerase n=1 Tax=Paraphaeosphaeria minitans TaxID=565426 RepID=A0A9P6KQM2_9PLEO|nr:RNA-dependent RNA polymerase [Paraphaeosphaeria minitans]
MRRRPQPALTSPAPHPANMSTLFANSIEFGVAVSGRTMQIMKTVGAVRTVRFTLKAGDFKEIEIQFSLLIDGKFENFKFQLPLSLIDTMYKVENSLIIPFKSPPKFWMQKGQIQGRQGQSQGVWYRQTDVVDRKTREELAPAPVMTRKEAPIIDIGRWTTYRITFDAAVFADPRYIRTKATLADHGIHITTVQDYSILKGTAPVIWSLLEEEISGTHPHLQGSTLQESAFHGLVAGQVHLPYDVRYQLEVCLSNGVLLEHNITREFLERLGLMSSVEAVNMLEKAMNDKQEYLSPMEMFNKTRKSPHARKLPSYCILSRSANITPTLIHVGQPAIETSNRIIRKHLADADRFIRVRFTDEKTEGSLFAPDNDSYDVVFDRVTRAMTNGVVVAGRYYEFLAFGNSQFRERGAYFYAPTPSKSADDIRRSMGKFDHIKIAAKYGARLGQCFSTTRAIKSVNVKIEEIQDIERNEYCFTDGVGKISTFLAQMAAEELGLPYAFHDPPSLYQFRLAGCKGVLALDPSITGHVVHIRPSQYKFEAQNVGLEIIRASALSVATFNRQLIVILSTLGVPDAVFIQKQQEMVNDLERATKKEDVALEKLQRNIDLNQTTLTMAGMIIDGFMQSQEPFMMSLLQLWRAYHIKYLKEKARIMIEEGAYVLGCVDETATLRGHYDDPQSRIDATREQKMATLPEIFLQITDTVEDAKTGKKGHYKVIQGVCILARNPSLHAGDVRVVRAVDVPALHHLKDVVVLSQTGDRDIANMCSGGDLDGDDYIVLWDNDFLPQSINEPPMDFTAEKPTESTKPITVKDITDFFVTHMKNDSLGRIANAHMAQADFSDRGVRDKKCLELAKLHSQAVDYSKSGIPAKMDPELRPRKKPHFLRNKFQPERMFYRSKKVLGKLFDQVQLVDFMPQYDNKFDRKILGFCVPTPEAIAKAEEIKYDYDSELRRLMAKHAIRTEFEAWSVFVLSHNLESRDYTFAEEFGRTIGLLKTRYQELCFEAAGVTGRHEFEKLALFVTAMYTVTAFEVETAVEEAHRLGRSMTPEDMPLMSFPWLFVNELGKIRTGKMSDRPNLDVPQQHGHGKKHTDSTSPAKFLGDIVSPQGITHFGEILKLDFHKDM